jgi:hypothetical protein
VFHFNKKHLEDETIPMWVIKTHGESFYVNHVTAEIPWTTKETPDNAHTKGSLKFKECLLSIDVDNCATISKLSLYDKVRLRNQKLGITRIMWTGFTFEQALKEEGVKHTPFKRVHGACSTAYTVCDLLDKNDALILGLKYPGRFRVLMPNEPQYRAYDDKKLWDKLQSEYDVEEYAVDDDD